jgi:phosphatidylserine decarboxylase
LAEDTFWLKDNRYSLYDMFGARKLGITSLIDEHFVGGTVYQAHLTPWMYHRWHAPVSGTIIKSYRLEGTYFLKNPSFPLGEPHNTDEHFLYSQPIFSMVATRHILIIRLDDGSGRLVAVLEIGMTEVSSCTATVEVGQSVQKGQEIGYFQLGGSSYALVFDRELDLEFHVKDEKEGKPVMQLVNSRLATFK